MLDLNTPVLVGVGQVTQKEVRLQHASSPVDLMERAARLAAKDAGLDLARLRDLDALIVVRSFREATQNSPAEVAQRLGADKAEQWLAPNGGNGPQYLVNRYAEEVSKGRSQMVLLTGAEAIDSARRMIKNGDKPDWHKPSQKDPKYLYSFKEMATPVETAHGIVNPSDVYALFENALRSHYGRSIDEHQQIVGELFAKFSDVAAQSEHAWFPVSRSAEEIVTASPSNRLVSWPYTKLMCAMNQDNQSAALLLTSVGYAKDHGIDESSWIFLHGCADCTEIWNISDRVNYFSSPAIRLMGERALDMAQISINDIDFFDLYSCFPSAVEIARDELGIGEHDSRPLTVTGGLPFHGGAGNNYVMNSIAAMVDRLRAEPGKFGMVTANGGFLGKHAAGIYSTVPTKSQWQRESPATYQALIDDMTRPSGVDHPSGIAHIETYSVTFNRDEQPERGIVIGRLGGLDDPLAPRFVANTPKDCDVLRAMTREEFIGRSGRVTNNAGLNVFSPEV